MKVGGKVDLRYIHLKKKAWMSGHKNGGEIGRKENNESLTL